MELEGIGLFVFVGSSIMLASVLVVLSAVFLTELSRMARMRRRRANPRLDFLQTLLRGVAHGEITNISELHTAYRIFFGLGALKASHLEEIADFLRTALARSAPQPGGSGDSRSPEQIQALHELLDVNQRALEIELQCLPFSGTPEPERQLLEYIFELTGEDKTRIGPKLDGLAKAIRIRQDAVERLGWESSRSLTLARWGWFGAAAFSILSIILGLLNFGG